MVQSPPQLTLWLKEQLSLRGWSPTEFAGRAGTKSGTMSPILQGRQRPGFKLSRAIAKALDVPEDVVLELAGHFPPRPGDLTALERLLLHHFRQLSLEDQTDISSYIQKLAARRGDGGKRPK